MTDEMVASEATVEAEVDGVEAVEDEARPRRVRPVKLPDNLPSIVGVAPEDVMKVLGSAWRSTAGHDAPTLHQLAEHLVVHVDVDLRSGYVAVTTDGDSYRAIGIRRELVVPLVAVLTGRRAEEVTRMLAGLPGRVASAAVDLE